MTELGAGGVSGEADVRAEQTRSWRMRLSWLVVVVALLAAGLGLLARSSLPMPATTVQHFDQAWLHSRAFTEGQMRADGRPRPQIDAPLPTDAGAWSTVMLPLVEARRRDLPAQAQPRPMRVWWYRVDYVVPQGVEGALALYVPRITGGAAQVIRFEEGQWKLWWDGSDRWREQWNRPVFVDLGAAPPAGTTVSVAIGLVRYDTGQHRVSHIDVGPREALATRDSWRRALQLTVPEVGSLTFLALGLFALVYWLRRRRARAYLLFFFSSVVWTLRSLHYFIDMPADPVAYTWFWWATNASLSWVMMLIYLFAFRFDSRRYPRVERALVVFVVAMSALTMPFDWSPLTSLVQQHVVNGVVALMVTAWLTTVAWRGGAIEFRVIVVTLWLSDLLGAHDLLMIAGLVPIESVYLLPFATVLVLLSFLFAVQQRYAEAIERAERINQSLEARLAAREAELRANHERLRLVEREQALLLERQRLMRDMHDGLGSTLMSTLVLAEQGNLQQDAVAALLRECVDDLRLVIDSLEPIENDLVTLLASLRHRLGRRLEGAGLRMQWEVDDLPPVPWLNPPDALQVLRIVQEVLTNVLKHAQARTVRIATRLAGDHVQVQIEDDGCGFDADLIDRDSGRGLRHLVQRAARLDGRVTIDSAAGRGTRVTLDLPLQRGSRP
ncbi:ATP-binding protein [Ideonella sp. DXS29W]|uniref:histidine kinase n=1 Tax=Ideonella lacteola TaxID=2984193 RepID=A0ABU9BRQ7_9BURK